MATLSTPGPIRTAKTPKRVRFASEHQRAQQRIARQEAFERRDARALPRVDAEISTHYDLPSLSAFGGVIADYAKNSLGSVVELGKTALGKVIPSLARAKRTTPKKQSMLEYPPFLVGATPNVVKKNRRDYYQSADVLNSIQKAKSYDPTTGSFRTPEHMQSDKEKNWYRFHDTPYKGHNLDFSRNPESEKQSQPVFQFNTPSRSLATPSKARSSKSAQRSALKKRNKSRLGTRSRRSNVEEFHANFVKPERNELYASYTRFLNTLRFDVRAFAKDLQDYRLPIRVILKLYDQAKRADWDFFLQVMADEEYWAQVKGVGNTKVPQVENYKKPEIRPNSRVNPCDYCNGRPWAGKIEVREVERDGDPVERRGQSKFEIPYTPEEQSHIDGGRYHKVFHRFCHESRYDWKFPDPSKPCSWDGPDIPAAVDGPDWLITKYDPRLRHFPLLMYKMPKRIRQHQIDLDDMVKTLSEQDRAAWLYIQGIRRYNMRMADMLEKMDLERKRNQVLWPCQLQVEVKVRNKPSENESMEVEVSREVQSGAKRQLDLFGNRGEIEITDRTKRVRLDATTNTDGTGASAKRAFVEDCTDEGKEKDESKKKMRVGDAEEGKDKKQVATQKIAEQKSNSGKFGLFFDGDESIDDTTMVDDTAKATVPGKQTDYEIQQEREEPKKATRLSFTEQIYNNVKQRERELAEAEAKKTVEKPKVEPQEPVKQPESSKIDFLFKQHFAPPIQQTLSPKPPSKGFIFEDKVQDDIAINVIDEGSNALKEHTNGVKPSATPNLFGNAGVFPALNPFGLNVAPEPSPLKSFVTPTQATENEENVPQPNKPKQPSPAAPSFVFGTQATTSAPITSGFFAPVSSATTAPSTQPFPFAAPKADESKKEAPSSLFKLDAPKLEEAKNKVSGPVFSFGAPTKEDGSKKVSPDAWIFSAPKSEQSNQNSTSGLNATTATEHAKPIFQFGKLPTAEDTKVSQATTGSTLFGGAATSVALSKPLFQFGKPATEAPTTATTASTSAPSLFGTTTTSTAVSGPLFSLPATTSSSNLFSAPATTGPPTLFLAPASSAPAQSTISFGQTTSAPSFAPASATAAPSIFSGNATTDASKPAPFVFGGEPKAAKPAEIPASTSAPVTTGTTTAGPLFQFGNLVKQEDKPAIHSAAPPLFNFGVGSAAGNEKATTSYSFGATTIELPKAPTASPAPKSPGINRSNTSEDISMASPEQSPQKQSPRPLFGPNGVANGVANGFNNSRKNVNFSESQFNTFAPSPLNFSFGANQLPEPSPIKFGPSITGQSVQPTVSNAPPTLPGTPAKFDFASFGGSPAPTPGSATPTPAPTGASGFHFDTSNVDFSLTANPSTRKIATPRRRFGKK